MSPLFLSFFLVLNMVDTTPCFVKEYHQALTEDQELQFINKYKNSTKIDVKAYVVSLKMKQSKYKFFPWQKIKVFNKYKKHLEELISKHPKNVHLRYVRLVIQEKIPKMLNYYSEVKEDKEFLIKIMNEKDNADYLDTYIVKNTSL